MKPQSALYYIKHNKGRAAVMIFMIFFTCTMYIAGNYIKSTDWYWEKAVEYDEKIVMVGGVSSDEDFKDYRSFIEDLKKDEKLTCLERSAKGFSGKNWKCTLGWEMGTVSYVFNSVDDMKKAFDRLGITCDFTDIKDGSMVMSSAFAKNCGLKKGDLIDRTEISSMGSGYFSLDALIEDDSFICFFVCDDSESLLRAYVMSDELSGSELRSYIENIKGDRVVQIGEVLGDALKRQLSPIFFIFLLGCVMLSIILAVTAGSVITGQYIKRVYEFGIYRAIGFSKRKIRRKCASEILMMDLIAVLIAAVIIFTVSFLLNQLVYQPAGMYLPYFSTYGLGCFLLSNLMVVLPMIISQGRKMAKADVTEF